MGNPHPEDASNHAQKQNSLTTQQENAKQLVMRPRNFIKINQQTDAFKIVPQDQTFTITNSQ